MLCTSLMCLFRFFCALSTAVQCGHLKSAGFESKLSMESSVRLSAFLFEALVFSGKKGITNKQKTMAIIVRI